MARRENRERDVDRARKQRPAPSRQSVSLSAGEISIEDRFRGCLLGLAIGDALGTTVEFAPRGSFPPITDMVGGGPFGLKPGQWTDDTSMALCLAESLLYRDGFDPVDQMNRYVNWWQHGYFSSTGECFDIGGTTQHALNRYLATGEAFSGSTDPRSAGNGSLMRLAAIPLFYYPDPPACIHHAAASSRTTHGAAEAVECCELFAQVLLAAVRGLPKEGLLSSVINDFDEPAVRKLVSTDYTETSSSSIKGSGYCVESLAAAFWSFFSTATFAEAVLAAVNLGDDADTTAAITGQIAGAYYGVGALPRHWITQLSMCDHIDKTARRLFARVNSRTTDIQR
jgi:ADP-ribosyl-[dinitrogen reductase] hydrolase